MANRYWVGGGGQWSPTNTSSWSTTAGGPGGASVPTSLDKVFFTNVSNISVSIQTSAGLGSTAYCFSLTSTGAGALSITQPGAYASTLEIGDVGGGTDSGNISFNNSFDGISLSSMTIYADTASVSSLVLNSGTLSINGGIVLSQGKLTTTVLSSSLQVNVGATFVTSTPTCYVGGIDVLGTLDASGGATVLTSAGTTVFTAGCSVTSISNLSLTIQNDATLFLRENLVFPVLRFNGTNNGFNTNLTSSITIGFLALFMSGALTITASSTPSITINGLNTAGCTPGSSRLVAATGTTYTLNATAPFTFTGLGIQGCNVTGGPWSADATCVDIGNNTGITFTNPPAGLVAFLL